MEKFGSGKNIPDPQHWLVMSIETSLRLTWKRGNVVLQWAAVKILIKINDECAPSSAGDPGIRMFLGLPDPDPLVREVRIRISFPLLIQRTEIMLAK
jgi:hypothetical protein